LRVEAAYQALTFVVVAEAKGTQVTPQLAIDTGCADQWKDMPAIVSSESDEPAPPGERWFDKGVTRVCLYETEYIEGNDTEGGHLQSGAVVPEAQSDRLADAFEESPPPLPCDEQHTGFAVIHGDLNQELYLGLDGCRRILAGSRWRQGDSDLVATVKRLAGG